METQSKSPSPFRLEASRQIYSNSWIRVREDRVLRPSGKSGIFGVVDIVPGCSILAINDDLQVLLSSEYKYAVGRVSREVAGGGVDPGESPLAAAQRELREELGFEAERWIAAGHIEPLTTVVNSRSYLFIALRLTYHPVAQDTDEQISFETVPLATAIELVLDGSITHAATCVLILKAQRLLAQEVGCA